MKLYITIAGYRADPVIHLANSEKSTYCQFEKTTHRQLVGFEKKPIGTLCVNCLTIQNGGVRPGASVVKKRPMFEFDTRKLPPRPDIDMTNPLPPWE